jgi:hypothetical protein
LAHAPGAGKTCEAIVASLFADSSHGRNQVIFIVPPSLTANWAREILKWTGEPPFNFWPSIYVVGRSAGKDLADWDANFLIVPDSMLAKDWVMEGLARRTPKLLAVDEASRFKEQTAERTKALFGGRSNDGNRVYYGLVQNARHAVLLDGSPMPNRPMELWTPVTGMAPETIDFLSVHDFGVKYCKGHWSEEKFEWNYTGASKQDELNAKLTKRFMHVVTESELSHPERRRSMIFMTPDGSAQIKTWEQKNVQMPFEVDEKYSRGQVAAHRQKIGLAKVDWVVKYVRGRLEQNENESLLVFAWHRAVCRAIAIGLRSFGPGLVQGGVSTLEREDLFRRFQSGACRVIVANIAAMGRGHNLQRAKRVVFAEYSWTDEHNKQCEKRASRKGSTADFVRCDYVVASNTMDENVLRAVFTKAKNVERVIG